MATHRYRSRDITGEQILFIRQLIADHPELSRWKLSRELCEAWQWKQANGLLRDMVCRGLLLMLHRAGEIELPPVKRQVRNRLAERQKPEPVIPDTRPVRGPLASITPLEFMQVRRTCINSSGVMLASGPRTGRVSAITGSGRARSANRFRT